LITIYSKVCGEVKEGKAGLLKYRSTKKYQELKKFDFPHEISNSKQYFKQKINK
jgi:hypothetical protein